MLPLDLDKIPSELKCLPQWVVWRIEERSGNPSKVPYDPTNPERRAKADNPATWGTFEKAVSVANTPGFMGIGFEFSFYDPYCGIDLDKCRIAETGEIEQWAREILKRVNSYTEISPSGQGVHILVKTKLPPGPRRKGNVELYDVGRYFTMTGYHVEGTSTTIEERQAELTRLHEEIFSQGKKEPPKASYPPLSMGLGDFDLIDKAHRASNGEKFGKLWRGDWSGYPSQSEATAALLNYLVFYSGPDPVKVDRLFRRSGLMRIKWDRPQVGSTWGALEIEKAINRVTQFYTPPRQNATSMSPAKHIERRQQAPERKEERAIPIFPQEVMTGAAGRFAEVYSRFLESAPAFLFMSYLTFLGHLLLSAINRLTYLWTCAIDIA